MRLRQTVHRGTILKILDAATRAPSSGNTQPWELFVAGGDALDRLRHAYEERFSKGVPGSPDLPAPQTMAPRPTKAHGRTQGRTL